MFDDPIFGFVAPISANLAEIMKQSPAYGETRSIVRYAWFPRCDPETRRWFWGKRVLVTQRLDIVWVSLVPNGGLSPCFDWITTRVVPQ